MARFDVLAVNIKTAARRLMAENLSEEDAEATKKFAVIRRGVDEEFYISVPRVTQETKP